MSPTRNWCQYELNWFDRTEIEVRDDVGEVHARNLPNGVSPHTLTGLIVRSSPGKRGITTTEEEPAGGADI
jgi:hypothetical protein